MFEIKTNGNDICCKKEITESDWFQLPLSETKESEKVVKLWVIKTSRILYPSYMHFFKFPCSWDSWWPLP